MLLKCHVLLAAGQCRLRHKHNCVNGWRLGSADLGVLPACCCASATYTGCARGKGVQPSTLLALSSARFCSFAHALFWGDNAPPRESTPLSVQNVFIRYNGHHVQTWPAVQRTLRGPGSNPLIDAVRCKACAPGPWIDQIHGPHPCGGLPSRDGIRPGPGPRTSPGPGLGTGTGTST